ncbi:MAG TPA: Fur family transcriptional regulator [Mycobacteriales bacterium]|nr:Fur family transcriptional regulator [Mycobacteriales bacterium]
MADTPRTPGPARATRQGAAVQAALARSASFRSAQDLYSELRRRGDTVGLTTVYRHLQTLADAKAVDVLHTPEGETVYRLCGSEAHHHHLVCRRCGLAVEIEDREVERWSQRVAAERGFVDVDHTVEVFGTCAACAGGSTATG